MEGLSEYLEELSRMESVSSIIPGRIIRQNGGRGSRGLFLKYRTSSGYKLLYKIGTSVQEVFVVCKDPQAFEKAFAEKIKL